MCECIHNRHMTTIDYSFLPKHIEIRFKRNNPFLLHDGQKIRNVSNSNLWESSPWTTTEPWETSLSSKAEPDAVKEVSSNCESDIVVKEESSSCKSVAVKSIDLFRFLCLIKRTLWRLLQSLKFDLQLFSRIIFWRTSRRLLWYTKFLQNEGYLAFSQWSKTKIHSSWKILDMSVWTYSTSIKPIIGDYTSYHSPRVQLCRVQLCTFIGESTPIWIIEKIFSINRRLHPSNSPLTGSSKLRINLNVIRINTWTGLVWMYFSTYNNSHTITLATQ